MESTSNEIIGKVIFDRYEIECRIGIGGRGEVYRAIDHELGGPVAVKRPRASVAEDPQELKRFEKEPRVTHRLKGPYVVFVYSFGRDPSLGDYFSVMEYVPGGTLNELLDARERMPISEALRLTLEICDALDWIHNRRVVHCDLKPSNILVTEQTDRFPIRLADFGVAYLCDEPEERGLKGTPLYASPEQLTFGEDSDPLDGRADLYSLGIILYEMLTGDPPFLGTYFDVITSQTDDPPRPPRDTRADITPSLNDLILKALAKDPKDRFQSAREMSHAIQEALKEEEERTRLLDRLYTQAMRPFVEQEWEGAVECFTDIVEINPLYRDAQRKLEEAQHQARLGTLRQEAIALMDQEDWHRAREVLTELSQIAPGHQDVVQRLKKVDQEIELAELYAEGERFQAEGEWTKAQNIYVRILTTDASYRDVAERLVEAQRQQRLAQLYQESVEHIRQERWDLAVKSLEQITNERPDYRDAAEKLAYTREQANLSEFYTQGGTYESNRDWANALEAYKHVVDIDPDYKDAAARLLKVQRHLDQQTNYEHGRIAMAAENWQEAVRYFEAVQNMDPDYEDSAARLVTARQQLALETNYKEGRRYLESDQWSLAMKYLKDVIEQDRGYRDAAKLLSRAQERAQLDALAKQAQELCQTGQWQDAIIVWGRVLEHDPDYPGATRLQLHAKSAKAKDLLGAGQLQQATELADDILKTDPDYPGAVQIKLDALFQQAVIANEEEKWQEAFDALNQLLDINPKYPKAAALRRSVVASHRWDITSRFARRRLIQSPVLTLVLLLLACVSSSILLWSQRDKLIGVITETPPPIKAAISEAELRTGDETIDNSSPQLISEGEKREISAHAIDSNGEPIASGKISCSWSFIPDPEPREFATQEECNIMYHMPPGLGRQSVRVKVKGKDSTSLSGISSATVEFFLSTAQGD